MEEVCENQQTVCVPVSGEIDHHQAKLLRASLGELVDTRRPRELVLDLAGVAFMDSAGLGLLLGRYRRISAMGGSLTLINAPAACIKMLRLSGADRFIKIEQERKEMTYAKETDQ